MSTLTVGTITEKVTDAGVAVDGVTLKDGGATFTNDITIGDASASDKKILFDGNAQDFHIGLDDSSDSLTIGLGSALGTTSHMVIDANGHVTMPNQPAFNVHKNNTHQDNFANDGEEVVVTWSTERFDNNGDFSGNTFTAPVTGKYILTTTLRINTLDTGASFYIASIVTSNNTYHQIIDPNYSSDLSYRSFHVSVVADMDSSDTAYVTIRQSGGTVQSDVNGDVFYTYFAGALLC